MKRNDSKGKHGRKPNEIYCMMAENNAIKEVWKNYLVPFTTI